MKLEEFLEDTYSSPADGNEEESVKEVADIDVQKAVVESLAADKAEQDEKISELTTENSRLREENSELKSTIEGLKEEIDKLKSEVISLGSEKSSLKMKLIDMGDLTSLKNEVAKLRSKCAEQVAALEKVGDVLAANSETALSNKVSLLDRDEEIPDRFPGETRDHVLEVIAEAQKKAEKEGFHRRAQVLEGVLLANTPDGTLAEKRAQLEKLFASNGNIVSGPVIEELTKLGISHKNGDNYLMPSEIIKRNY
jgi:predicted RNase H-like nuclease (RuvC/YqgF family)